MIRNQAWTLFALGLMAAAAPAQEDGAFAIRGRVVDAAAKPVADATVRLLAPGFDGFDVDDKTTSDAQGRFRLAAPPSWTRMDSTQRQELGLIAQLGERLAVVQFDRHSTPPRTDVVLTLSKPAESKIAILSPDFRPVAGARIKLEGLLADTIRVDLTPAEVQQYASGVRKTALGHVIRTGLVSLPPDLQRDIGATDAKGVAAVTTIAAAIGALTIHTDAFGDQTFSYIGFSGTKPPDWPQRIVLKKTGRVVGHLLGPGARGIARRELTLMSFQQDNAGGMAHGTYAQVVTDGEGRFEVPRMVPGTVQWTVKSDASQPLRPEQITSPPRLKAGETLDVKIALKAAVRVEGRVLEADSKKPIPSVLVRAFLGTGFESATSDVDGKFAFWMPPGETAFHPTIPEEYLPALSPSDYFNPAKRQQTITVFKVPEGKSFEAPPILLHRAATLRGVVVDVQGQPLPGSTISGVTMAIDRRTGQPKPREVTRQANERGEFTIPAIDPREPMRLRVTAREVSKVVTIAKPGRELVRIVFAQGERFRISGQVADAEGKPIADALLEVWHRDWRPLPPEAEPQKLALKAPVRTDAQGRFETPSLLPDGHYRFTIRAAGVKTTESAWLDATRPEAAQPQHLVVTRLGGMSGVVCDRGGKPIADAQVSLFARDTRTETNTNRQGEFKVEIPAGKPFCLVVRHPEFRVQGAYYEKKPQDLKQILVRLTEAAEKLPRRPLLTRDERASMFKQLFEPIKERLVQAKSNDDRARLLQALTGVAPDFVVDYVDQHPLQPALYNEMLLTQAAMKRAERAPDEVEEMIGRMSPGAQKSMAYGRLVDVLPEKARSRKLELLAEALIAARAERSPDFRAIALGKVATRLFALGEKERAATLLRDGEKIARGLSTGEFAGYARGAFATDLALIDLPAALVLMKGLKDPREFARHHGNTAHRIAGIRPADAVRVLDMIPPPGRNEFNQRDHYAIRVCYRMAKVDQAAALKLAGSIIDLPSRAYALGVIAVAAREPKQAAELLRRAVVLLDTEAARPDSPQLTSPLLPGTVAAALVLLAEEVDATLVRECLWRAVALQRPHTDDPKQVWRYRTGNAALAMTAARYDGKLAEFLLDASTTQFYSREAVLARFLINPRQAVEHAAKEPKGQEERELLQLLGYVAAEDDQLPRLILNALGIWRIDVEDFDE